jgi:hypothetical protein
MDSVYMSDAMCQVGREEWKINMVGTCQTDRCDVGPLGKIAYTGKDKEISINSHESLLFQHKTKPLTYAVWGDNNFVKTLSNRNHSKSGRWNAYRSKDNKVYQFRNNKQNEV